MNSIAQRIGVKVAHGLAKHIDDFFIPAILVCIASLETIKKQLKEGGEPLR